MADPQQDDLVNHLLSNLKVPLENNQNPQGNNVHQPLNHAMPNMMNPGLAAGVVPQMATGNGATMGLPSQSQWEEYLGKYGASEADFVQHFAVLPSSFLYPPMQQQPTYAPYYYGMYQPMVDPTALGLYYQQLQNSYFNAAAAAGANGEVPGMPQELPQEVPQMPMVALAQPEQTQQVPIHNIPPPTSAPDDSQKGKPAGSRTWADVMKAPAKPQPPPQPAKPKGAPATTPPATPVTTSTTTTTTTTTPNKPKPDQPRTAPTTTKTAQPIDQRKREGKSLTQDRVPYTGEAINPRDIDVNPRHARFFVIKSYSEDDVHKSIKYAIWASTDSGNRRLDQAYKESAGSGPIFLFFSVNASGQFCGMAQMGSSLDFTKKSDLWAQDKWNGQFSVKWIFIKDIPNSVLRHIRLENNDGKPVTNSRDTQEILIEPGREMLKIFRDYQSKTSILDDLSFYDKRQEQLKDKKADGSDKSDGTTTPVSEPSSASTSPSLRPTTPPAALPPAQPLNSAPTKNAKATNNATGKVASNAKQPKKA